MQCGTGGSLSLSDRPVRYGMILLDTAPAILSVRGQSIIFMSAEETVDYAPPTGALAASGHGSCAG